MAIFDPKKKYQTRCNDGSFSTGGNYACGTRGGIDSNYKGNGPNLQTGIIPVNDNGVFLVPLSKIKVNTNLFQERDEPYAIKTVDGIIRDVKENKFRFDSLPPIVLWFDGKNYWILSGHSRTEAFKRLANKNVRYKGRSFNAIPAQILKDITEAEARNIALKSNVSTKPKPSERVKVYRSERKRLKNEKQLIEEIKYNEGKDANFIYSLTFLSPSGKTFNNLKALEGSTDKKTAGNIEAIASWIGEARKIIPELSNLHENEIYDWLMSGVFATKKGPGRITNKRDFLDRITKSVQKNRTMFDSKLYPNKLLNLKQSTSLAPSEIAYQNLLNAARAELKRNQNILADKTEAFIRRGASKEQLRKALIPYQNAVAASTRRLKDVLNQKDTAATAAKQQTALFGIGKIYKENPPGKYLCNDNKYSTNRGRGACSYHRGLAPFTKIINGKYQGNLDDLKNPYKDSLARKKEIVKAQIKPSPKALKINSDLEIVQMLKKAIPKSNQIPEKHFYTIAKRIRRNAGKTCLIERVNSLRPGIERDNIVFNVGEIVLRSYVRGNELGVVTNVLKSTSHGMNCDLQFVSFDSLLKRKDLPVVFGQTPVNWFYKQDHVFLEPKEYKKQTDAVNMFRAKFIEKYGVTPESVNTNVKPPNNNEPFCRADRGTTKAAFQYALKTLKKDGYKVRYRTNKSANKQHITSWEIYSANSDLQEIRLQIKNGRSVDVSPISIFEKRTNTSFTSDCTELEKAINIFKDNYDNWSKFAKTPVNQVKTKQAPVNQVKTKPTNATNNIYYLNTATNRIEIKTDKETYMNAPNKDTIKRFFRFDRKRNVWYSKSGKKENYDFLETIAQNAGMSKIAEQSQEIQKGSRRKKKEPFNYCALNLTDYIEKRARENGEESAQRFKDNAHKIGPHTQTWARAEIRRSREFDYHHALTNYQGNYKSDFYKLCPTGGVYAGLSLSEYIEARINESMKEESNSLNNRRRGHKLGPAYIKSALKRHEDYLRDPKRISDFTTEYNSMNITPSQNKIGMIRKKIKPSICFDGRRTYAKGRGTCSWHGGRIGAIPADTVPLIGTSPNAWNAEDWIEWYNANFNKYGEENATKLFLHYWPNVPEEVMVNFWSNENFVEFIVFTDSLWNYFKNTPVGLLVRASYSIEEIRENFGLHVGILIEMGRAGHQVTQNIPGQLYNSASNAASHFTTSAKTQIKKAAIWGGVALAGVLAVTYSPQIKKLLK